MNGEDINLCHEIPLKTKQTKKPSIKAGIRRNAISYTT